MSLLRMPIRFLFAAGHRYPQLFPVFCHCSSGDGIALFFQDSGELIVCEGFAFIFFVYNRLQNLLDFPGGTSSPPYF